jgi:hypothetical protein
VDKVTGDMMVRYTMAAQSALELLKQLLATCRAYAGTPLGDSHAGGEGGQRRQSCPCMSACGCASALLFQWVL